MISPDYSKVYLLMFWAHTSAKTLHRIKEGKPCVSQICIYKCKGPFCYLRCKKLKSLHKIVCFAIIFTYCVKNHLVESILLVNSSFCHGYLAGNKSSTDTYSGKLLKSSKHFSSLNQLKCSLLMSFVVCNLDFWYQIIFFLLISLAQWISPRWQMCSVVVTAVKQRQPVCLSHCNHVSGSTETVQGNGRPFHHWLFLWSSSFPVCLHSFM